MKMNMNMKNKFIKINIYIIVVIAAIEWCKKFYFLFHEHEYILYKQYMHDKLLSFDIIGILLWLYFIYICIVVLVFSTKFIKKFINKSKMKKGLQ